MKNPLRERALRLLARREHSRVELSRKLAPHAESEDELEKLLDDLSERLLLSDERYTEMRINARQARFGNTRLAYELKTQGVAEDLVASALASCPTELARAREVWQRKFGDRATFTTPAHEAAAFDRQENARQMRFLLSRGFSSETIRGVMRAARADFEDD